MDDEPARGSRSQDVENPPVFPRLHKLILAASLLVCSLAQSAGAAAGAVLPRSSAPFVMGMDADENTYAGKWMRMIYSEAFKRMGVPIAFDILPSKRLSFLLDDGTIDGDGARVYNYGALHPELIRVDVPTLELRFSLYAANSKLRLTRLEDLSSAKLLVEFRRGLGVCEQTLKPLMPPDMISDVTTVEQGVKKLLAGRTDLYCDNDVTMLNVLHSPEFKNVGGIHSVLDFAKPIPTYPYLHRKHAELVPRLAATLRHMKSEGLIEVYRLRARREFGSMP